VGKCDLAQHACVYSAKDADGDGHATNLCKSTDGTPIVLGDDCDDSAKGTFPGAWDGPVGDGNPDRCDGLDENCNGTPDDGKLKDGSTCTCTPGDTQKCAQDGGGQPITFPATDAQGNPLGKYCKLGKRTCGSDGKWAACVGAVAPLPADLCDGLDENCNGKVDKDDTVPPVGQITYTFDGDLDNHAQSGEKDAKASACPGKPPATCPAYYKGTCDPGAQWRTGTFPLDDCNDDDPNSYPGAQEKCNGKDDDCNGQVDDAATDAKTWVFDYDGDHYGDIDIAPVKSCQAPTTVPASCTAALAALPSGYCAGLPVEGSAPVCPPAPCAASMWVTGYPATDCKDNPGGGSSAQGNKPQLVHPGGTDLCNGLDYACQGTPDIGCGCAPIGDAKPCGDTQTCNAGTKTCNAGGTWDSCSGGDPQQRLDYCLDKDTDGFCDLTSCISQACPGDAPVAMGWKEKSLCLPAPDCNDADPTTFPSSLDTCNGDGVDHNCNGVSNLPGAGDCDCIGQGPNKQTQVDCKPQVGYYPPSASPGNPAAGTPGYVKGSALTGVCKWGVATCDPTGHLGTCSNAVPGQSTEQCNGDGSDYNCNGVKNTTIPGDCGCVNGATQACGVCGLGSQTCVGGTWGSCADPGYSTYCEDKDKDMYCNLANCSVSACPNSPEVLAGSLRPKANCNVATDCNDTLSTAHPGAQELCGDGINENCDAMGQDSDTIAYMSIGIGGACDNGQLGSCNKPGNVVCSMTGGTTAACNAGDWSDKATFWSGGAGTNVTSPVHGSFDTDCNGKTDVVPRPFGSQIAPWADSACSQASNAYLFHCTPNVTSTFIVLCNWTTYDSTKQTAPATMIGQTPFTGTPIVPTCGQQQLQVLCITGNTTVTPYLQDCH
jgi:hypothetical protein